MKHRDFTIKGNDYHLNDNHFRNEYEGKYILLVWNRLREQWQALGTVDSKLEAIRLVKEGVYV